MIGSVTVGTVEGFQTAVCARRDFIKWINGQFAIEMGTVGYDSDRSIADARRWRGAGGR